MIYQGTDVVEVIAINPMNNTNETHYINMVKSGDYSMFYVTCCCNADWFYEFAMENNSDYERVKFNIMEAIFKCDTVNELLCTLSDVFEEGFGDILIENNDGCECECCDHGECECQCDGDCGNCRYE